MTHYYSIPNSYLISLVQYHHQTDQSVVTQDSLFPHFERWLLGQDVIGLFLEI